MNLHKQIENAVQSAWNDNAKVVVIYELVSSSGVTHTNLAYPSKGDIKLPDGSICMLVNVSLSACKMFSYDEQYQEFVYDIAVGGKPFLGNIPPRLIKAVYDMDSGKVYYAQSQDTFESVVDDDVELKPASVSLGYVGWQNDAYVVGSINYTKTSPKGVLRLVI